MPNEKHGDAFGLIADASVTRVADAVTATVNSGVTAVLDVVGYDWIDWFFIFSAVDPGTSKAIMFPESIVTSGEGPLLPGSSNFRIPYEPAVVGTGTTEVYSYGWEYDLSGATRQAFRTPVIGPAMRLSVRADAENYVFSCWAFRRKVGGPKAR